MKNIFIGMFVSTLIILGLTFNWGLEQKQRVAEYNVYVENQYQRMFYNLVGEVENIQSNLAKVMVTGTPQQNVMLFSDLMYKSYTAQDNLTQLPIDHSDVSKTQKFLSQIGDFSMAMARKNLKGIPLTNEDMTKLEELHNYSNILAEDLLNLQDEISDNDVKLGELIQKTSSNLEETNEHMMNTSLINVEERMQEYPELIYDGPFSEHIINLEVKLQGNTVDKNRAIKAAEEFMQDGNNYTGKVVSEIENTRLPAYLIDLYKENEEVSNITMAITKKAGKPLWMLNTEPVGEEKISKEKAIQSAGRFLKENGFENMQATYSEEYDGQIVVNFAYKDGDVLIYTDLIKVKVALDNGSIKGFEADGYLSNHHQRNINKPKISEKEAKVYISVGSDIEEVNLAIIPTEGSKEVLCYEFKVNYKEDSFLVYINAESGVEEKILQLIIKEKGILMI